MCLASMISHEMNFYDYFTTIPAFILSKFIFISLPNVSKCVTSHATHLIMTAG